MPEEEIAFRVAMKPGIGPVRPKTPEGRRLKLIDMAKTNIRDKGAFLPGRQTVVWLSAEEAEGESETSLQAACLWRNDQPLMAHRQAQDPT
jgi:hypothetical protein